MKNNRLDAMEKYILQNETVSMEDLCRRFNVSMITVRRDVAQLQLKGTVEKIYGGVSARHAENLTPFDVRFSSNSDAKSIIASRAASYVREGETVFLDSGSTALRVVDNLAHLGNITIITHSLQAIMAALPYPNINIISLPGQLYRKTGSFTGLDAIRFLGNYNISLALMGTSAFSLTTGVSNSSPLESEIKATAMRRAERRILLTDSSKFGKSSMLTYAHLPDFNIIITERMPPQEYVDACAAAHTELVIAGADD